MQLLKLHLTLTFLKRKKYAGNFFNNNLNLNNYYNCSLIIIHNLNLFITNLNYECF